MTYNKDFVDKLQKTEVDSIDYLSPSFSYDQDAASKVLDTSHYTKKEVIPEIESKKNDSMYSIGKPKRIIIRAKIIND